MSEVFVTVYIEKVEVLRYATPDPEWSGPWVVTGFKEDGTRRQMSVGFESERAAWAAVVRGHFDSRYDIHPSEKRIAAAVLKALIARDTPDLTKELLPE